MNHAREPYENLANAIVKQAVDDWRTAVHIIAIRHGDVTASYKKREIEEFFHSKWFILLTSVDGEYVLDKLKKEAGIR